MRFTRLFGAGLVVLMSLTPVKGRGQAQPVRGWVGVVITTGIGQANAAGAMVFSDYPVIESIDPGSPAERAGLQAGDMIMSLNSQDLRKNPIPMSSMLQPGQKIVFRYMRNDVTKASTINVVERPVGTSGHFALSVIGPAASGQRPTGRLQREAAVRARTEVVLRRERAPGGVMPTVTVPIIFGQGTPSIAVAGAELTQLNDGLRDVLQIRGEGVFVINVAMGTPAGAAGLKSGDVIVRADREMVQNPGELLRVMQAATENSLMLQVLRKRKTHSVTLRW